MNALIKYTLASAYVSYRNYNKSNPYISGMMYLIASVGVLFYFLLSIIDYFFRVNFLASMSHNMTMVFSILHFLFISIICFICYPINRVKAIVVEYESKPKGTRIAWGFAAILFFAIPLLGIVIIYI